MVRHYLFIVFAWGNVVALYLAVCFLIAQILQRVSAHYAPVPEDQALTQLRKRIEENRRQSRVRRLEAVWDEAQSIIAEEETAREASRIIRQLDEDAEQDFALEVDAAQAYLEYRDATDGRHVA
jgi:hypothetical protein